jgi:transcriptional regulator with XRE-family HTH domain
MDDVSPEMADLALKIKRLVEERGWNQEEFARIARLNRHTVRQILLPGGSRRLRNATISACARALGITVNELRTHSLERLLPRMAEGGTSGPDDAVRRTYEQATLPAVGGIFPKGFHAVLGDGSVRFFPKTLKAKTLEAYITRNGGEVIGNDD